MSNDPEARGPAGEPEVDEAAGPDPSGPAASGSPEPEARSDRATGPGAGEEPVAGGEPDAAMAAEAEAAAEVNGAPAAAGEEGADTPVGGDVAAVAAERDHYLDHLRRVQAEFENYRKRIARQQTDAVQQAGSRLVDALLPVLDACDAAVRHGAGEVEPIFASLLGTLEKEGLARIDPGGESFDPTSHEAVMHEPADGDEGPVVSDVLRPGYAWKGRVLRPAMVKVKG